MTNVYISSDFEGIACVSHWDEVDDHFHEGADDNYQEFRKIYTNELLSIFGGLDKLPSNEIVLKEAHSTARNFLCQQLPSNVSIIRNFSGHIDEMMEGLREDTDAVFLHGYHAAAGTNGNPLSHTINSQDVQEIRINDRTVGEVTISLYIAATHHVPVCFISGDSFAVKEARQINPQIIGVATKTCMGQSVISQSPQKVNEQLLLQTTQALHSFRKKPQQFEIKLPKEFKVEITYYKHQDAFFNASFPGVKQTNEKTIQFSHENFLEVMRLFHFCL